MVYIMVYIFCFNLCVVRCSFRIVAFGVCRVYHYKAIGDEEGATTNYVSSHKNKRKSIYQQQTVNGGFSIFWFLKVILQFFSEQIVTVMLRFLYVVKFN
jgi:hypothetical protein